MFERERASPPFGHDGNLFVTGDASDPAAPSAVEWRDGKGINTGRHVLAAVDYLYDAACGLIGFRGAAND